MLSVFQLTVYSKCHRCVESVLSCNIYWMHFAITGCTWISYVSKPRFEHSFFCFLQNLQIYRSLAEMYLTRVK